MSDREPPRPGQWYRDLDLESLFEVTRVTADEVSIQFFDGDTESFTGEQWQGLSLESVVQPRLETPQDEEWFSELDTEDYPVDSDTLRLWQESDDLG